MNEKTQEQINALQIMIDHVGESELGETLTEIRDELSPREDFNCPECGAGMYLSDYQPLWTPHGEKELKSSMLWVDNEIYADLTCSKCKHRKSIEGKIIWDKE